MTIHSDKQPDRNEPKRLSPNNSDLADLAREQVPGRQFSPSSPHHNNPINHLDLSDDIYHSKYELLAGPVVVRVRSERVPQPGKFAEPVTYKEPLSRVFGNSYSELGRHHNQILDLDLSDLFKKQGIGPNEPVIVCNADTHSDMHEPPYPTTTLHNETVGNWVNRMIADNKQITDFYWVMPDELKNNEKYRPRFFADKERARDGVLASGPRDQSAFVDNATGKILWKKPKDYSPSKFREVGIHKRTLDEMPDMKGKNVIWTTDLDYFDNEGHGTVAEAVIPWQGEKGFEKYVKTMDEKHIRPFFHFISQSTEWTSLEHTNALNRFAVEAGAVSLNGGDINIANYRDKPANSESPSHQYQYQGITVPRQQDPQYELLYQLFAADARTTSPDGAIVLNKPNEEYNAAIEETIKAYKGHEELARSLARRGRDPDKAIPMKAHDLKSTAKNILRYLDSKDSEDGKPDGILNFRAIEDRIVKQAVRKDAQ